MLKHNLDTDNLNIFADAVINYYQARTYLFIENHSLDSFAEAVMRLYGA